MTEEPRGKVEKYGAKCPTNRAEHREKLAAKANVVDDTQGHRPRSKMFVTFVR